MTELETNPSVSFVVATYNRSDDLVEAIDSILDQHHRPIEIIIISNSTDDDHEHEKEWFCEEGQFDRAEVRYCHFAERMGAPKAKNRGLEQATGEIIVQLDDDAVIKDPSATDCIIETFREHKDVGIQAFQSRNYHTDELKRDEVPDPPEFEMTPTTAYRTTNFIGLGVAFRRDVLEKTGLYPENFVYGFEEMDLSFRVHDTGYDILYTPSVAIHHKKAPEGRLSSIETKERLVENRIKLALRNLPWRYVVFTTLFWSVYGLVLTRQFASLVRIYRRLYASWREALTARHVVSARTIARIKSRKTMLFCWWYGPHPRRLLGPDGDAERLFWET
ncbi:glycosyltransferase family 2 protein [Halococcus thailandensis]|uniref:Putative Glycosyl transferase, family 2 n=1 Tax=Halococcus thailandensis JCM 13552 TaxID=1227457 RepID=M0NDY9_9EURY|nr:glycosyltransferase family 2 protein [Halococcus thailandensis]EMA56197.1 putative Glycosyl transferase, family 2 [Halococcus thailandensis JCM 13552]